MPNKHSKALPPHADDVIIGDGSVYDQERDPPGQRSVYVPPGDEKKESYRLSTFVKFPPDTPITPRDLAATGFYYTGYKDRVKCFNCGLCVENWVVGDDVKEARWHRSNCDFINGQQCGNVPIGGIFSRILQNRRSNVLESTGARQRVPALGLSSGFQNESNDVPMDENVSNISSTHTATAATPPSRFLSRDFQFATINSIEHENFLRSLNLKLEVNRLDTFRNWPTTIYTVNTGELAQSGFFYLGNLDRTQCFSCGGVLRNWTHGDNVDEEHRQHFGHCLMARGIDRENVPLNPEARSRATAPPQIEEPADPNTDQFRNLRQMFPNDNTASTSSGESPSASFPHPWRNPSPPLDYTIEDATAMQLSPTPSRSPTPPRRSMSNNSLYNNEPGDEASTGSEGLSWSPRAPDHQGDREDGEAFLNPQRPVLQGFGNGPARRSPPPPIIGPQEDLRRNRELLETAMQSEITNNALAMDFSRDQVKRVTQHKISTSGSAFESTDELVEALTTQPPGGSSDEEEPGPRSPVVLTSHPGINITGNVVAQNVVIGNRRMDQPTPSSSRTPAPTPMGMETNAPANSENKPPLMQKRLKELQEERMCKVCLDRPADIVFVPCGHLCCCFNCATSLRKCPVCRKKIDRSIRTYMS